MILIFSNNGDRSTTEVMRWLEQLGREVVRVNARDRLDGLTMSDDAFELEFEGRKLASTTIDAVWYRKGDFWFSGLHESVSFPAHPALAGALNRRLRSEAARLKEYFHTLLCAHSRVLGHPFRSNLNKLDVLRRARAFGFDTPSFMVTTRTDVLLSRLEGGEALVTKPISDGVYAWDDAYRLLGYFSYTERVSKCELQKLPARIVPSLVQILVPKCFELRVFFLDGVFFPAAIFSQSDPETTLDFRKYNEKKPTRIAPFELPVIVSDRLRRLFGDLELNTGSVDMIVDDDGRFVFLEINPVGQYEWIAHACNFPIDRAIARWLAG